MSVQNVLQGVLSQKVVADGGGGYAVKNDIVNVDTVKISSTSTQAGRITFDGPGGVINLPGITADSIVIVTPVFTTVSYFYVTTAPNQITIVVDTDDSVTFNYYVAKY